jgi:Spy/CpxP family protein refolding chaperone
MALLAILLLCSGAPLLAQDDDMGDNEAIILAAGPAPGNPPPQGGAGEPYGPPEPFAPLDLSKEQITKMHDLWLRHFADSHDLRYDLMQKRLEIERLFTDPKADPAALMAKEKELALVRERLMEERARTIIGWRSLLTPEQIGKLDLMTMTHHRMLNAMSFEMGRQMMGFGMGPEGMGPEGGGGMGPMGPPAGGGMTGGAK